MRSSTDEASPLRELTDMSAQGPSNPFGDRPRMAEALASLKEGLRDTADPLYDGWKLRQRAAAAANHPTPPAPSVPVVPRPVPAPAATAPDPHADAAETIEIALDAVPDETPSSEVEPPTPRREADGEAAPTLSDDWFGDGPSKQEPPIEALSEDAAPIAEHRPSVQIDTVRVRVIRYQHFPRWALIAAAAFFLFAVSALVLRASFPRLSARSTRALLASETATPPAIPVEARGLGSALGSSHAAAQPPAPRIPEPSPMATPPREIEELAAPAADEPETAAPAPRSISAPRATASPVAPAYKSPSSSPRRRPGGGDFFRDPGF